MIEGIRVTVPGAELADLCRKCAQHHRERREFYLKQRDAFRDGDAQPAQFTGGDPVRACDEKAHIHEQDAKEMDFTADHIDTSETYQLGRDDLYVLGIVKRRY